LFYPRLLENFKNLCYNLHIKFKERGIEVMITKETLIALMGQHEAELREYRLSGDAEYLLPLIN
jgi:hypothetical protein